jgi:hypothetical protein
VLEKPGEEKNIWGAKVGAKIGASELVRSSPDFVFGFLYYYLKLFYCIGGIQ